MKMTLSSLENDILLGVIKKPKKLADLLDKYVLKRKCSKSGFYKCIGSLGKKEIIVVKNKFVSVNKIWLIKSQNFFDELILQKTKPSYLAEQVFRIKEEDKITYVFRSISEIDIFILNLIYDLLLLQASSDVLILEQHEFFVLLNKERTASILEEIKNLKSSILLLVKSGLHNDLDREIIRKFIEDPARGHVLNSIKKDNSFNKVFHVVGEVIIELHLNKKFSNDLHSLFLRYPKITETFFDKLKELVIQKGKHKIVIYKNKNRSMKVRRQFRKYFIIP